MPSLRNIDGRTLAGDTTGLSNLLLNIFGTKQSREKDRLAKEQQEAVQRDIGILSEGPENIPGVIDESGAIDPDAYRKKAKAAMIRLSAVNPQIANSIRQTLERGDKIEKEQVKAEVDKGVRLATMIRKQPDYVSKQRTITQLAQEAAANGQDVSRFVDLANKSEEQLDLEIDKMLVQGADIKTLVDDGLNPAGDEGFTLSQGQTRFDSTGKEVASVAPKAEAKTTLIKNMEAAGISADSAEGKRIIRQSFNKTGTTVNVNTGKSLPFKLPNGFMLLDENNPSAGVKPIPGSKNDSLSAEAASKTQMLKTGLKGLKKVKGLVYNVDPKTGERSLNTKNIGAAAFNIPFTDGRKLRNGFDFGIQAVTRAETGAAMPPSELENTRDRFMPKVGDTVELVDTKIEMFEDFMNGAIDLIDPTGSLDDNGQPVPSIDEDAFDAELESRTAVPPNGEDAAVFTGNKTPEGYKIFKRPDGSTFAVKE